jgi:hypothetical protein
MFIYWVSTMKRSGLVFSESKKYMYGPTNDKYQAHNTPNLILKANALIHEHICCDLMVAMSRKLSGNLNFCSAQETLSTWKPLPVFKNLQNRGDIVDNLCYKIRTFHIYIYIYSLLSNCASS